MMSRTKKKTYIISSQNIGRRNHHLICYKNRSKRERDTNIENDIVNGQTTVIIEVRNNYKPIVDIFLSFIFLDLYVVRLVFFFHEKQ